MRKLAFVFAFFVVSFAASAQQPGPPVCVPASFAQTVHLLNSMLVEAEGQNLTTAIVNYSANKQKIADDATTVQAVKDAIEKQKKEDEAAAKAPPAPPASETPPPPPKPAP